MKIHWKMAALFAVFILMTLCACGGRRGSEIVQTRRGSGSVQAAENAAEETGTEQKNTKESDAEGADGQNILYLVTKVDTTRRTVVLETVGNGRQVQYGYDTLTRFLNKYGDSMAAASLAAGDVVSIQVSSKTDRLTLLQLSDEVWVQEDITNYSVNESSHAITIGKTKYSYESGMQVFSGDTMVDISDLSAQDVLRAVGMDKKLVSLSVTKGHGYLALANTKIFEDSFICVGDKIFELVTHNMKMEVPEGTYLVTVANDGYGGSREVTITRDQTTSLNLDELKGEGPKFCEITFLVGVEGAVLQIDGETVDYSKPVKVRYGTHTVAVGADGYDTLTEKLVVNSKEAQIEIALTSADSSGKTDSGSSSDSGNNSQNTNTGSSASQNAGSNNTNNNNANNSSTNNNTNNSNTNNGNANNNSAGNNSNNNTNNAGNDNAASNDYLTTLYNLLTSINNSGSANNSAAAGSSSSTANSYENLVDQ